MARKVILFGSRARGDARSESDVDILVVEDEPFGPERSRTKEMARLWQACRNQIVAHALKFGRVLYERR